MLVSLDESPSLPSVVVPGGETNPATTFMLYQKGAQLPNNSNPIGVYEDLPLDEASHMPTTKSEVYLAARNLETRIASERKAEQEKKAAEAAAKQAEIDRKVKYYDEHYSEPQVQSTSQAGI